MDFYSYYKERFTWGPDPYQSTAQCQREVTELLNNHLVPFRIAAEGAIGYLAALHDFAGDGCSVSFAFRVTMNNLINNMQRVYESVDMKDKEWAREVMEASGAPPYDPTDYEVQDVDLDGEDTDGLDDAPNLSELYGDGGESGTTGTRRPFPDWQNISFWTVSDWVALQTYKDKLLAAAEHGFIGVSSVANVLTAASDAMIHIPLPRQVELSLWATEIVDGLIVALEEGLSKMCAGSLYSHEGRRVQKQLLSVTPESTEK